jgi:hypothetical protein
MAMMESFSSDMPSDEDYAEMQVTSRVTLEMIFRPKEVKPPVVILTIDTFADDKHMERIKQVIDDLDGIQLVNKIYDQVDVLSNKYEVV